MGKEPNADAKIAQLLARDPRYREEAYLFVSQAVNYTVKKLRHQRLEQLGEIMKNSFSEAQKGKTLPVIFETVDRQNIAHGWSDNYIAVSAPAAEIQLGKIVEHKLI